MLHHQSMSFVLFDACQLTWSVDVVLVPRRQGYCVRFLCSECVHRTAFVVCTACLLLYCPTNRINICVSTVMCSGHYGNMFGEHTTSTASLNVCVCLNWCFGWIVLYHSHSICVCAFLLFASVKMFEVRVASMPWWHCSLLCLSHRWWSRWTQIDSTHQTTQKRHQITEKSKHLTKLTCSIHWLICTFFQRSNTLLLEESLRKHSNHMTWRMWLNSTRLVTWTCWLVSKMYNPGENKLFDFISVFDNFCF